MKYAINFYRNCRVLPKADEIIIKYEKTGQEDLVRFARELPQEQRLIVNICMLDAENDDYRIFKDAISAHKNMAFMISRDQTIYYQDFYEMNLPYFFIEPISNLDDFMGVITLGVTDIYVANELGFYLNKISTICKDKGIQIRVYPNVAQSSSSFPTPGFKKFFIRPEDVELYEQYVDILEFWGPIDKQAVLYDIYHDGRWQGNLQDIILNLNEEIDNMRIMPVFGEARSCCHKKCAYNQCHFCDNIKSAATALEVKEIVLKRKKRVYEHDFDGDNLPADSAESEEHNDEVSE